MKKEIPLAYILDDEQSFLDIFEHMLIKLGFAVECFTKEVDFINRVKEKNPNLCFIDLNMHGFASGYPLVKSLYNKFGSEIPIFVVSGQTGTVAVSHAIELGASDYILKPIDNALLASKLFRFFSHDETQSQILSYLHPEKGIEASLFVELNIIQVDELGVSFESKHLLSKGSVFYLNEESFEFLKNCPRQFLSVISNEAVGDNSYRGYAEFAYPTDELLTGVRRWIQNKNNQ